MDWQTAADSIPSGFIPEATARSLLGKPPASGAWRDGDPVGSRKFLSLGSQLFEGGGSLPEARIAFETWGTLNPDSSNAILILHALTGDSHVIGEAGPGHQTSGWWTGLVGPGCCIDIDRYFVVAPNVIGGCQGSTGPSSLAPDGQEWGSRFPFLSIRDQVQTQAAFSDAIGIGKWAAIIGGSMGGMQALEWATGFPDRAERVGILAAPAASDSDSIALNSVQIEAIQSDPGFRGGDYYDALDGEGPHNGLALARRIALLSYRSSVELNDRFGRTWQSGIDPIGGRGKFAIESYLDFHGNKFTRRFDANSYLRLAHAMSSHDVGRGRGGIDSALSRISARALVLGVTTDRLFPLHAQQEIASKLPNNIYEDQVATIDSEYGHDGFLINTAEVANHLDALLSM